MKLACYKGPPDDFWHAVGHTATCVWTGSRYSHAELVFGEPDHLGESLCASASARDGGVRFKNIDLASGRWDVYALPGYDKFDEAYAYEWFSKHQGTPYDYFGLVWFVLPIRKFNHPHKQFCSEAIASALGMRKPHKFHPQRLLDAAMKA